MKLQNLDTSTRVLDDSSRMALIKCIATLGSYRADVIQLYNSNLHTSNSNKKPYYEETYELTEVDKKYIHIEKSLKKQWQELRSFYESDVYDLLKNGMKQSLPLLLDLNPNKISLQISYDKSIFYTIIKNGITIYFDHFIQIEEDMDEVVVNVYKNKQKIFSGSSSLENSYQKVQEFYLGETLPSFISNDELSQ